MYHDCNNVIVDMEKKEVRIMTDGEVSDTYKLVNRMDPKWTDQTKTCAEVIVKLVVSEIETKQEITA